MIRPILSMVLVGVLSAWVGGQSPVALRSDVRAKLYRQNRSVIEPLVEKTLATAKSPNEHLKRADGYYKLLFNFNKEITQAIDRKDQARVSELSQHLQTLLDKGLAPTLAKARQQVEGGTGAEEFPVVKDQLISQLDSLLSTLDGDQSSRQSLFDAKSRLLNIKLPQDKE